MESEIRAILADAVGAPEQAAGLFAALLDRMAELGGVDLDLPAREERPRAADLSP
jgi:plasmid stability protein